MVSAAPRVATSALLSISGLRVQLPSEGRFLTVLDGVDLSVAPNECVGLVGESGAGKSMTGLAIMRLLPPRARVVSGEIWFEGRDLLRIAEPEMARVRGAGISVVFQDPISSLNPSLTVGQQIAGAIQVHRGMSARAAREEAIEWLSTVGIPSPRQRSDDYPHEFSGGMAQRVMVAMAVSCRPKLMIADELTTSLDLTIQAQILELTRSITERFAMGLLLISHDLGVIAQMTRRVAVMYAGQIVEEGTAEELFGRPKHPYTEALLAAWPDPRRRGERLATIKGLVPSADRFPPGCRFHPRCEYAADACRQGRIELEWLSSTVATRCIRHAELTLAGVRSGVTPTQPVGGPFGPSASIRPSVGATERPAAEGRGSALVEARGLRKRFPLTKGLLRRLTGYAYAVNGVDFDIAKGETLGLVGESGSGKTTVGRMLLRLVEPTAGTITFDGQDLTALRGRELRAARRKIQAVFQNPYASLDPQMSIDDSVAEPLLAHTRLRGRPLRERVAEILHLVKLDRSFMRRYPHELSGGQRQRAAIARALALNPKLVVCDEPTSSLDVSVRAQVVNLLEDLREELGLSYLFISHDLSVVHHISHRIAVMYQGEIVESGPAASVYGEPLHPYTQALVSAVLIPDPTIRSERIILTGEPQAALEQPVGCPFAARCPHVMDVCRTVEPPLVTRSDGGWARCHLYA